MKLEKTFRKSKVLVTMLAVIMVLQVLYAPSVKAADNTYYDSVYYNTGILTSEEWSTLANLPKGTVIIMSPVDNDFYYGEEAEDLVVDGSVTIVSIPGVGSSSIGTAAFAKHIAVARDEYVAGIVAGLGTETVGSEGSQGYYIGRSSNVAGTYYVEPSSDKLAELYTRGARPELLIGHSKGNMDVANALYKLYWQGNSSMYQGVRVITFGCGVFVPSGVEIEQYLGSLDSLGITNTVSYYNLTWVYGRYHTTNPYYYWTYMPIEDYVF